MIARRSFLRLTAASAFCAAGSNLAPVHSYADSNNNPESISSTNIPFTAEVAKTVAENYLCAFSTSHALEPISSTRLLDTDLNHIGHIVWLSDSGIASGYMVLDTTSDGLLTDFSFSSNASPLMSSEPIASHSSGTTAIKVSPLEYAINVSDSNYPSLQSDDLDCVCVSESFIRLKCTVNRMNHWQQFIAYDDEAFMAKTNRYACMVCSFFVCAEELGLFSPGYILPGEFNAIWSATNTEPLPDSEQNIPGITQGKTDPQRGTYGFQTYAKAKGKSLNTNYYRTASPTFFSDCIDQGGVAVAHIRLQNGLRHAVAVEGYVNYTRPDGVGDFALIVYDAHQTGARYIQFANANHIQGIGGSIYW